MRLSSASGAPYQKNPGSTGPLITAKGKPPTLASLTDNSMSIMGVVVKNELEWNVLLGLLHLVYLTPVSILQDTPELTGCDTVKCF